MDIKIQPSTNNWSEYILINNNGLMVSFLNYGGIITNMVTPNRHGKQENIILSYKDYNNYQNNPHFLGALIGRVAGRIENSAFQINDSPYTLEKNEGVHHLHGGENGLHQIIWDVKPFQQEDIVGAKLCHTSADMEGGYPGEVEIIVTYTLTNNNKFTIRYEAISTKDTIFTLTNHSYFNLTGNANESIQQHIVQIPSNEFLQLDDKLIPTGKLISVDNTPFDFRKGSSLSKGLHGTYDQNKIVGNGYDHYFMLDMHKKKKLIVNEPKSGRILTLETTQPGLVMYTGNHLDEQMQLNNGLSKKYSGMCLETQAPPASIRYKNLPSIHLAAHRKYDERTIYTFASS